MDLEERELHLIISVIGEILRQDADDDDFIIEELLQPFRGERMLGRNRVRNGEREFSGIENYIERTVTGYTDPYFKKHFRMSRRSFQVRNGRQLIQTHKKYKFVGINCPNWSV